MKLRYLAPLVALALATVAAHAQVGLYLNPVAINVSNSVQDTGPFNFLGTGSTERTFWGADFGGYYDFYHVPGSSLTAGIDLRQNILHANNAALKEFLIGVRVSGKPFTRPFRPYAELTVGEGATKSPSSQLSVKKVDFRFFGGVDYPIHHHVDFRIIEVGYGTLTTISSATVGAGGTIAIPASRMVNVSSGLVFRF